MSYKQYTVKINFQEYKKNPVEYIENLKQIFSNPCLKEQEMLYVVQYNEYVTWNVIGTFTESSLNKLHKKLQEYTSGLN